MFPNVHVHGSSLEHWSSELYPESWIPCNIIYICFNWCLYLTRIIWFNWTKMTWVLLVSLCHSQPSFQNFQSQVVKLTQVVACLYVCKRSLSVLQVANWVMVPVWDGCSMWRWTWQDAASLLIDSFPLAGVKTVKIMPEGVILLVLVGKLALLNAQINVWSLKLTWHHWSSYFHNLICLII